MLDFNINQYQQRVQHVCKDCGRNYTIGEFLESSYNYFSRPWNYRAGCETYCLECWLGVGPIDFLDTDDEPMDIVEPLSIANENLLIEECPASLEQKDWPFEEVYEFLVKGDLLKSFKWFLDKGINLAVMPIARVHIERVVVFPGPVIFYPPGVADIEKLNLIPNRNDKNLPSEYLSAASGITESILNEHALVVLPCRFDWNTFRRIDHRSHMDLIRKLSEEIDRCCLNFVRYRLCRLEQFDDFPAHAGQVNSNHMMAGALFYSCENRESRIIGGAAFTHYITRGLGLNLKQLEWDEFPQDGEVGQIINHALSLYAVLMESISPTPRFMQALSLLEFLAFPDEYQPFKEVKKVIARYVASDQSQYDKLLERFLELTGKKDPNGQNIGYRTRVVHMGRRIESIVPDHQTRTKLFVELDDYIRAVIDHMITHSDMGYDEYLKVRETLRPFEI